MQQQVKIGVLGAASITPTALIQPASQISNQVTVYAVAARNVRRASDFASRYGICKVMSSYEELVESSEIDAVYIGLPIAKHFEWSIKALQAGKHVLCEKTLTQNAKEARILQDVAKKCEGHVVEAFHYRYHPLTHHILKLMRQETIGKIEHITSHFCACIPEHKDDIRWIYSLGGGSTMEIGCYAIHLVRSITGEEPEVRSAEAKVGPPMIDVSMRSSLLFPSGVSSQIFSSMDHKSEKADSAIKIKGTHGTIQATNPFAPHLGHTLTIKRGEEYQVRTIPGQTTYLHQLYAFLKLLSSDTPVFIGIEDSIANMCVIDSIYQAAGLPPRGI